MGDVRSSRRLVVNADDFGLTPSVNQAVKRAHEEGILTTASLMVNGADASAAVEWARRCPRLGVGLHLVLVLGRATLPGGQIPGLVDASGCFGNDPVRTGLRYFLRPGLREQLRLEIAAQFARFQETGLPLDHVNGHLNLHLHPTVLRLVLDRVSAPPRCERLRLTRDLFGLNARLATGAWIYRISHACVFALLTAWARPQLARLRIRHTDRVFGLLQNGRVDEAYLLRLIPQLPEGDSELYSHPSLDKFPDEFNALVSERVRTAIRAAGVQLIRYQDL